MTNPEILEWLRTAPGVAMDPDGAYGLQCVDLADQYAMDLFGVPWQQSVGGVGGARELLDKVPDAYWIRTNNDPNKPNQIPKAGDLVVFDGTGFGPNSLNPYGHVAVVVKADQNGMDVIQQDGFTNTRPAHHARLPYYGAGTGLVSGWLTPRENKIKGYKAPTPVAPPAPSVSATQRVATSVVNYRPEPNTSKAWTKQFQPGDVLNFVGFVRGEKVGDSNIWYKGTGGGFIHSSGVKGGANTSGLKDLTPAPPAPKPVTPPVVAADPTERIVGSTPANQRSAPTSTDDNITAKLEPGFKFKAKGYVHGEKVGSSDIWLVGAVSGHYVHISTVTNQTVSGLKDITPVSPPKPPVYTPPVIVPTVPVTPPTAPVEPVPVTPTLVAELPCVTEVVPAHPDNYQVGNFPTPTKWVPHQFGKAGSTLAGVKSWFAMGLEARQKAQPGAGQSSAHFAVDAPHCVQFVSLRNRAYGSRSGNDRLQVEIKPNPSKETIELVRTLVRQASDFYGVELTADLLHKDIPGNSTECGTLLNLADYQGIGMTPKPSTDKTIKEQIAELAANFNSELTKLIGKL